MSKNDVRLRDVFAYFVANCADADVLQQTFYEKLEIGLEEETSEMYVSTGQHCSFFWNGL